MTLAAFALAYAGMTAFCLAMERHHADVFGAEPTQLRSWALRLAGSLLLALAFVAAASSFGVAIGLVAAIVIISIAGLCLVFLLAYAPHLTAALAPLATLAAIAGLLIR